MTFSVVFDRFQENMQRKNWKVSLSLKKLVEKKLITSLHYQGPEWAVEWPWYLWSDANANKDEGLAGK